MDDQRAKLAADWVQTSPMVNKPPGAPFRADPRRLAGLFCALMALLAAPRAEAHPHVWIDATVTPIFDEAGRFAAIHEKWTFDAAFTEGIGPDLDVNKDGILEDSEIQNVTGGGSLWFVTPNYFTRITIAGRPVGRFPAGAGPETSAVAAPGNSSQISSTPWTSLAPCWMRRWGPTLVGESMGPGTAKTSRPCSRA